MNKKNIWIIHIICAIGFLVAAFFLCIYQQGEIGKKIASILVGIILLLYSLIRFLPDYKKYSNHTSKILLIVEILVVFFASYQLIIVNDSSKISLWVSIIIYLRGFIDIINGFLNNHLKNMERLLMDIGLITLGSYFFAKKTITDSLLNNILLVILLICTLTFVYLGLKEYYKKNRNIEKKPS